MDDEAYRLSHVLAAENDTSVSAMVREYLSSLVRSRTSLHSFEELEKDQDELIESILKTGGGLIPSENLSRDPLYERNALH